MRSHSCGVAAPKGHDKKEPEAHVPSRFSPGGAVTQPAAGTSFPIPDSTPVPQTTPAPLAVNFALTRLSPEEFSGQISKALQYQHGWNDDNGQFFDAIVDLNGVGLGGVDFRQTSIRDTSPKVTTILTVRNLAYNIANNVVERDRSAEDEGGEKVIFTHLTLVEDRPVVADDYSLPLEQLQALQSGEVRWEAQLTDLYWRIYNRPPAADEMAVMKTAYSDMVAINGYPPNGRRFILYAMLSSMEAWYR